MSYYTKCGNKALIGAVFCTRCGQKLNLETLPAPKSKLIAYPVSNSLIKKRTSSIKLYIGRWSGDINASQPKSNRF